MPPVEAIIGLACVLGLALYFVWLYMPKKSSMKCVVVGCEEKAHIVSIPLGGVWLCETHYCEYKFEGKKLKLREKHV